MTVHVFGLSYYKFSDEIMSTIVNKLKYLRGVSLDAEVANILYPDFCALLALL